MASSGGTPCGLGSEPLRGGPCPRFLSAPEHQANRPIRIGPQHEHGAAPCGANRNLRSRRRVSESAKDSGRYPLEGDLLRGRGGGQLAFLPATCPRAPWFTRAPTSSVSATIRAFTSSGQRCPELCAGRQGGMWMPLTLIKVGVLRLSRAARVGNR